MEKALPHEIVEVFNNSLMISNLIGDYIVNNSFVQKKGSLLKKAKKAQKLIDEIHQDAHGSFQIETTVVKGKSVTKIINTI